MPSPFTPKWANRLLEKFISFSLLEEFRGDLEEVYQDRLEAMSPFKARLWYWADTLSLIYQFFSWKPSFLKNSSVMYSNYFKMAFRQIKKSKFYSALNILGLSLGFATFFLLFMYVDHEFSYDKFHENSDQIYRVSCDLETPGKMFNMALTPPWVGPRMAENFPEIKAWSRIHRNQGQFTYEQKRFQEDNLYFVDKDFLDFLSFNVLRGDAPTALAEPNQIVLTEPIAKKYFGEEDPIGKTLLFGNIEQPYTVTGVVSPAPSNSQFSFDMLLSFSTLEKDNPDMVSEGWFRFDFFTYILLDEKADPKELEAKFPDFVQKVAAAAEEGANQRYNFLLESLVDIHLTSEQDYPISAPGNLLNLYIFIAIAILILVIASINFVNLATARAFRRAREVGVRKVVGAHYRQLIGQFLTESFVITLIAFLVAIGLTEMVLPSFNELSGKTLSLVQYASPTYLIPLLGLCTLVSFLSGIFPAFVLAKFRPVSVLKSNFQFTKGGAGLRRFLVIFQLTISILLLTGTWVIHAQWEHLKTYDLGYEKEQLLMINYRFDSRVQQKAFVLKEAFLTNPAVEKVSVSMNTPVYDPGNWYANYEGEDGEMQNGSLNGYIVDFDFLDTYGMEVIAGRAFSPDYALDSTTAFMINEAAVTYLNWGTPENAIGKKFRQYGKEGKIIGVIKNFHYQSLHSTIEPLAMQVNFDRHTRFTLRMNTDDHLAVLNDLKETWGSMIPFREMDYQFVDQTLEQKYEIEAKTESVFRAFAILTLIVACLGILGLAAFMASQQRKEVSIRKVLGAQVPALVFRYSKSFIFLALIAFAIAMPIAWWGLDRWLQNFPYQVELPTYAFWGSGLIVIGICWLTVAYHAFKTAMTEPAVYLRSE